MKRASSSLLDVLLDKGVDAKTRLNDGSFLIHHASNDGGTPEALRALLSRGIDSAVKNENGLTPVHLIASSTKSNREKKMQLLIENSININVTTPSGQTALHLAVLSGALPLISMLLQNRSLDVNHKDETGRTALIDYVTIKSPNVSEMASMLLQANNGVSAQSHEGRTVLHYLYEQPPSGQLNFLFSNLLKTGLKLHEKTTKVQRHSNSLSAAES